MHKGPKPPGQPRSIRSIAEAGAENKNFPAGLDPEIGWRESSDPADALKSPKAAIRPTSSSEKNPFNNIRGK